MPTPKPIYRLRNIILLTLAALGVFIGREVYLALTAKPGHAIDFAALVEDLIESGQPKGAGPGTPDAWPVLQDIIERESYAESTVKNTDTSGLVVDFSLVFQDHNKPFWDKEHTWAQADALAERSLDAMRDAGIFESMRELARLPRAVRPTPKGPLIEILLPELGRARQLARINGARMYLAHKAGDEAEFVDAYEQTLALARIMCQQSFLIEHLVGIAIVALADNRLREAMTEHPFSARGCEQLLAAMDRQLPLASFNTALRCERLSVLDIIQWTHTDDGRGSGRLIIAAAGQLSGASGIPGMPNTGVLSRWKIFNLGGIAFPSKAANIAKAEEFFDKLIAYAGLSYAERRKHPFSADQWIQDNLPQRYAVLRMSLPSLEHALGSRMQCDMDVAGTRTMIAIELFNARNGRYPASLDELVPSILRELPEDPYPAGKFVYRLITPDEDEVRRADGSARPYLLYCCGADGVDNGAKVCKPSDVTALRLPAGKGFDLVLNQPAERAKPDSESDAAAAPKP